MLGSEVGAGIEPFFFEIFTGTWPGIILKIILLKKAIAWLKNRSLDAPVYCDAHLHASAYVSISPAYVSIRQHMNRSLLAPVY
jgi:hypothetical protein